MLRKEGYSWFKIPSFFPQTLCILFQNQVPNIKWKETYNLTGMYSRVAHPRPPFTLTSLTFFFYSFNCLPFHPCLVHFPKTWLYYYSWHALAHDGLRLFGSWTRTNEDTLNKMLSQNSPVPSLPYSPNVRESQPLILITTCASWRQI